MEPTESAAPHSRLRRITGAWRGWVARTAERSRAERGAGSAAGQHTVTDGRAGVQLGAEPTAGLPDSDHERHLSWPALPASIVAAAGFVLGAGFYRAFTGSHALFPSGTVGWSLAVLTGVIVGHLVALGRARWWGGTGSGAALTL
ncbi:MAG: GGDEF-domain containing protein, partial [Streptomyces sp.]|nr:GGDEF-domain containing protein [Streptomyces sp.]